MRRLPIAFAVSLLVVSGCSDDTKSSDTTTGSTGTTLAVGEPEGTVTYTDLDRSHVDTPVDYPQTPPVGGAHNPVWQTCQFYDVEFPKERGVHSMEHGAVWITFDPVLAAPDVAVLAQFAENGNEVLVSPFTGLPSPIVASAWGKQLLIESVTDPRLAEFVTYFDDGPQTPETNTPCAQGTTETS
ncbi:MAG: DUF3105 domain-containing protein [Actinomycetia bacterium]|nr:DUF3105 domain-containing protein [Actinomycetes bacterium]